MNDDLPLVFNKRTGVWCIPISVKGLKKKKWVPTGERTREKAVEVVRESGADRLELLHQAGAVTAQTIALVTAGRRIKCEHMLAEWGRYLRVVNSGSTPATYLVVAQAFIRYAGCEKSGLGTVKEEVVDGYVNDPDVGLATRGLRLAVLRQLFKYANAKAYILGNPAALIRINKRTMTFAQIEGKQVLPFTEEEYQTSRPKFEPFWQWAMALAYWTGLRMIDVCCLEKDSLTFKPGFIIVHTRKSSKRIALPLADPLIGGGELITVIAEILLQAPRKGPYCFPDRREKILSPNRNQMSQEYTRKLERRGVKGKSFHCLRHNFASRLRAAGKTIEDIGELLGHSSPTTTQGYIHEAINSEPAVQ